MSLKGIGIYIPSRKKTINLFFLYAYTHRLIRIFINGMTFLFYWPSLFIIEKKNVE